MSSQLPIIDLTSAVLGSIYKIDFTAFVKFNPANVAQNAHLAVYNESGCGMLCSMQQSGTQFFIPAGGWGISNIAPNDAICLLTVQYLITNAPVSNLIATYYAPNEEVPQSYTLGNSPVGGNVSTSGGSGVADHLINTTNAASSSAIINIQETGASGPQVFADNQGNFEIQDYVASVLTTIFRVIAGGAVNSVDILLGDANRQIQFNGITQAQKRIFANAAITALEPAGSNVPCVLATPFSNNNLGFEAAPNGGTTGYTGFRADNSGTNATAGMGFHSFGSNIGIKLESNFVGAILTGLMSGGGIDMSAMGATSGASILPGPQPLILSGGGGIFSTVNGSVSGVCNLYTPIWTTGLKIGMYVMLSNYQTAVAQTLLFPSAMTFGTVYSGSIGPTTTVQFNNGGVAAAMRQATNINPAANTAGTDAAVASFHQLNLGQFGTSDRFIVNTTGGNNINSFGWFIGQ